MNETSHTREDPQEAVRVAISEAESEWVLRAAEGLAATSGSIDALLAELQWIASGLAGIDDAAHEPLLAIQALSVTPEVAADVVEAPAVLLAAPVVAFEETAVVFEATAVVFEATEVVEATGAVFEATEVVVEAPAFAIEEYVPDSVECAADAAAQLPAVDETVALCAIPLFARGVVNPRRRKTASTRPRAPRRSEEAGDGAAQQMALPLAREEPSRAPGSPFSERLNRVRERLAREALAAEEGSGAAASPFVERLDWIRSRLAQQEREDEAAAAGTAPGR